MKDEPQAHVRAFCRIHEIIANRKRQFSSLILHLSSLNLSGSEFGAGNSSSA